MGRRRMLPSRDTPVRAATVPQCPPKPRRRNWAASTTAGVGVYRAERRISRRFKQPLSGERPVECLA